MRKIIFLPLLALLSAIMFACDDENNPEVDSSNDKTFVFESADGKYLGDLSDKGTARFTLNLRKGTFNQDRTPSGQTAALTIHCYSEKAADPAAATLSAGTYNPGSSADAAAATFVASGTMLTETDAAGKKTTVVVAGGSFTVAKSGTDYTVTVNFTDDDGNKIQGSYSGAITFEDESLPEEPPLTLEATYFGNNFLTFSGGFILDFYYRDVIDGVEYVIGTKVMAYMPLVENLKNINIATGTYRVGSKNGGELYSFEPGHTVDNSGIRGTCSYLIKESTKEVFPQKYVTGGTMTVTDQGGGTYKVVADFTAVVAEDGSPTGNFSFEYTGEIRFQSTTTEYYSLEMTTMSYYGDSEGTDDGYFKADLFDYDQTHRFGMKIEGYMNPVTNLTNILPEEGTYSVADTGGPLTIIPGYREGDSYAGTYFYYSNADGISIGKAVMVTGGTYTIEKSAEGFLVRTNFSGVDPKTGDEVTNIKFEYEGKINVVNKVPGPAEEYGLNFTRGEFAVLDQSTNWIKLELRLHSFTDDLTYSLGMELFIPPVKEGESITIPQGNYEPGHFTPFKFGPGEYLEEINKMYGSGLMKIKPADKTFEHILITEGTLSIMQMGNSYMVMPYLKGINISTNATVSIGGSFMGVINEL